MTLRQLFAMVTAKRESSRTHAIDIASAVATMFDAKSKPNWERFVKTGEMKALEQLRISDNETPLIADAIARIRKNGGRFVLENN